MNASYAQLIAPAPFRLWRIPLDRMPEESTMACLSAAEHARAQRFVFDRDRRRFLCAHVALREILAAHTRCAAADLQFVEGLCGKPALHCAHAVEFNMSHSEDMAVVALSETGQIGVDIEMLRPVKNPLELAFHHFTQAEHAELLNTPLEDRALVFLRCWTRKEACLKALGSGLSIAPATFEAGVSPGPREMAIDTPAGKVWVRVQSLSEREGFAIALAERMGVASESGKNRTLRPGERS